MIPISHSTCDPCLRRFRNGLSPEETESVPEEYIHKDDRKRHVLRDLFTASFPNYCRAHQVPEYKLRVMNSLISCKTGKLGYSLIRCDNCGRTEMRACSCGNRNCPSCGYLNEKKWTALRQSEVIPGIPYFHLVFTLIKRPRRTEKTARRSALLYFYIKYSKPMPGRQSKFHRKPKNEETDS